MLLSTSYFAPYFPTVFRVFVHISVTASPPEVYIVDIGGRVGFATQAEDSSYRIFYYSLVAGYTIGIRYVKNEARDPDQRPCDHEGRDSRFHISKRE